MFARELATRLGSGQTANAVHPGVIATNLGRHMNGAVIGLFRGLGPMLALKSVPQGAATQCLVATSGALTATTGEYFADCNLKQSSAFGQDMALASAVWARSEALVAGL